MSINRPENWCNIADQYMIQPIMGGKGRIIVREDPFKSRFDCTTCNGKGHTEEECPNCKGTKLEQLTNRFDTNEVEYQACRACTVGEQGARKTYGFKLCPACNGRQGTIIVPDESQRNSTTGEVLAISSDGINIIRKGDKVLFTNYTGTPFKFLEQDLRVMCEQDILGLVKKLKENVDILESGTYADLENTGVPHE